jgi:hypothetical protein
MLETWTADEHLMAQARANPIDDFRLVFHDQFISSVVRRMDDNTDIYGRVLDDPAFQAAVMEHYLARVFAAARQSP